MVRCQDDSSTDDTPSFQDNIISISSSSDEDSEEETVASGFVKIPKVFSKQLDRAMQSVSQRANIEIFRHPDRDLPHYELFLKGESRDAITHAVCLLQEAIGTRECGPG